MNNFEKQLKKAFKEREIRPSEESWDKISVSLEGKQPGHKKYYWIGVAAGFIGLLIVSLAYVASSDPLNSLDSKVVDTPPDDARNQEQILLPTETLPSIPELIKHQSDKVASKDAVEIPVKVSNSFERPSIVKLDQTVVKQTLNKVKIEPAEHIIKSKLLEIIAQVDLMENGKDQLTDIEVDSLLRRAQKEILSEQLFSHDNSVDADALLTQVEDELDQSFRDQIFEKLKTGFIKVRTAVADRNN